MRLLLGCVLLALPSVVASQSLQATPQRTLIRTGRLIDGRSEAARPNMGILVEKNLIRAVG